MRRQYSYQKRNLSPIPQCDDSHSRTLQRFDDGRRVQMAPAVNDVAVDFEQLVANLQPAVFVGDSCTLHNVYLNLY